jgi:hypothetical protein
MQIGSTGAVRPPLAFARDEPLPAQIEPVRRAAVRLELAHTERHIGLVPVSGGRSGMTANLVARYRT